MLSPTAAPPWPIDPSFGQQIIEHSPILTDCEFGVRVIWLSFVFPLVDGLLPRSKEVIHELGKRENTKVTSHNKAQLRQVCNCRLLA